MKLRNFNNITERRAEVEKTLNVSLKHTGSFTVDESIASARNCENMIGVTQIPLGIAGPLRIQHSEFYIPLATTEGALVASINRGCKAISESGGATVHVERVGTTRGPVFKTASLSESHALKQWIEAHIPDLQVKAKETSHHITLFSTPVIQLVGDLLYVRFSFDTEDAMGMNMVTIATQQLVTYIEEQTSARCLSVSGNFCIDKKPSWQTLMLGRGFRAWSEVFVSTSILTDILKVTKESLFEVWQAKCLIGSALSGSLGYNGHAANIVGALYLATGQDIAHIVEGSMTITTMSLKENGILCSVMMPSVMVGTVGGGTSLSTQQEALQLLGIAGGAEGKNSETFAGIVAASVLAGELSELSALATGTLTKAHQQLGRGEK